MIYKKFIPHKSLKPFIECYYIWESSTLGSSLIVESPPSSFCSMVFNYGDDYTIFNDKYDGIRPNKCFFSGQAIKSYQLALKGTIGMLGIVFRPAGLSALFKVPMFEFVGEREDLAALFGNHTSLLLEQIYEAKTPAAKVGIIERELLQKLSNKKINTSAMDFAANCIVNTNGNVKIDTLLTQVFMSRRQFERRFLKRVGLSPKYYARVRRISNLCRQAVHQQPTKWSDLIYGSGYFDQAHFIRDFKEFMGVCPTKYYKQHAELGKFLNEN